MTFDHFLEDPLKPYLALIVLAALIAEITAVYFFILGFYLKRFGFLVSIAGLIVFVAAGIGAFSLQGIADEVKEQNKTVAENNLKKKYGIVDVLWSEHNTYPESYDLTKISVQDENNNILEFKYKLDNETREPQLLNISDDGNVKSKDLLLAK